MANVAVRSPKFRGVAVYEPNCIAERRSFFMVGSFLSNPERVVQIEDWNAILVFKLHRFRSRGRGYVKCESSLVDLIAEQYLVNRFRLDHLGREKWTCLDSSFSILCKFYQDRLLEEQTQNLCFTPRSTGLSLLKTN